MDSDDAGRNHHFLPLHELRSGGRYKLHLWLPSTPGHVKTWTIPRRVSITFIFFFFYLVFFLSVSSSILFLECHTFYFPCSHSFLSSLFESIEVILLWSEEIESEGAVPSKRSSQTSIQLAWALIPPARLSPWTQTYLGSHSLSIWLHYTTHRDWVV